jgi:ATP/maltotriose-dependent transcriptional regulator MalT
MTLARSRLLARVLASEARVVRLWAPPGYGKSSLARLFARQFDRHAICDCAGVSDAVDFAGRAFTALAGESQGGGDSVSLTRLRLHAIEADEATWSRALLEAWKSRQEPSLLILEHAEAIAAVPAALALLGDVLATRPTERVILISSRIVVPLRTSHYLAPNQVLTLSRNELRYDSEEAASVFEGSDLAPEVIHRIVRLADGWPTVLLLLALIAQYDAKIDTLLERLDGVHRTELHDELANEVLSAFTPDMMSTLLAMAAIPSASLADISAATGLRHATPIIDRLLHLPGFISSETGTACIRS